MTPKQIRSLIKMARAQGVTELTLDGISFKLGAAPEKPVKHDSGPAESAPTEQIPSEQEMLYWSTHSPVIPGQTNEDN